jgi:hypothetical protein
MALLADPLAGSAADDPLAAIDPVEPIDDHDIPNA